MPAEMRRGLQDVKDQSLWRETARRKGRTMMRGSGELGRGSRRATERDEQQRVGEGRVSVNLHIGTGGRGRLGMRGGAGLPSLGRARHASRRRACRVVVNLAVKTTGSWKRVGMLCW